MRVGTGTKGRCVATIDAPLLCYWTARQRFSADHLAGLSKMPLLSGLSVMPTSWSQQTKTTKGDSRPEGRLPKQAEPVTSR